MDATSTNRPRPERRIPGAYVAGLVLIVAGVFGFASELVNGAGQVLVLAVGVAFLALFAWSRAYGLLVAGGILTGLGGGLVAAMAVGAGESVLVPVGLGSGFLLIYVLDLLTASNVNRWWPLIPGSILLLAGPFSGATGEAAHTAAAQWSPAVLVVFGIIVLLRQLRSRGTPGGGKS